MCQVMPGEDLDLNYMVHSYMEEKSKYRLIPFLNFWSYKFLTTPTFFSWCFFLQDSFFMAHSSSIISDAVV